MVLYCQWVMAWIVGWHRPSLWPEKVPERQHTPQLGKLSVAHLHLRHAWETP